MIDNLKQKLSDIDWSIEDVDQAMNKIGPLMYNESPTVAVQAQEAYYRLAGLRATLGAEKIRLELHT